MGALPEGTESFDFIVIGANSGGIASAMRAESYGRKVCLIENEISSENSETSRLISKKVMFNLTNFLMEL